VQLEGINITRSQYSRLEHGLSLPNAAEIIAIASAFEVPYAWLLQGETKSGGR
jgi:transcriptional regulator with XRE-family HTH domain